MNKFNKNTFFIECEKQRKSHGINYADFQNLMEKDGFDFAGNEDIGVPGLTHVTYWSGWNRDAISLLEEYLSKFKLVAIPASMNMYLYSGLVQTMPPVRAKSMSKIRNYKKEHWLPVEFGTMQEWNEFFKDKANDRSIS